MLGNTTKDYDTKQNTCGLLAGAQILTMSGYVAIEDLEAGMRIVTRSGARALRGLEMSEVMTRPLKISPNTLGFSRPATEMFVASGQEILVRDWRAKALFGQDSVILPIDRLVDDECITYAEQEALHTVYSLKFDTPEVFYADGVELVSDELVTQADSDRLTLVA